MAKNSTKQLSGEYDLEPRGSAVSCTVNPASSVFYKRGVMLILKGVVF